MEKMLTIMQENILRMTIKDGLDSIARLEVEKKELADALEELLSGRPLGDAAWPGIVKARAALKKAGR